MTSQVSRRRSRRPFVRAVAVVGALVWGLAACSDSDPEPRADGAAVADGAELYADNCARCHGADLRGTERGPSHLSVVYEPDHHGDDAFRSAIANGASQHHWQFGDMPPIEGLDDDEVEAIIAYVRDVQEEEGFEDYPPQ